MSVATGSNDYWPLYLSIGNLPNNVCRAHRGSVLVVSFLAVPHGEFPNQLISCRHFSLYDSRMEIRPGWKL